MVTGPRPSIEDSTDGGWSTQHKATGRQTEGREIWAAAQRRQPGWLSVTAVCLPRRHTTIWNDLSPNGPLIAVVLIFMLGQSWPNIILLFIPASSCCSKARSCFNCLSSCSASAMWAQIFGWRQWFARRMFPTQPRNTFCHGMPVPGALWKNEHSSLPSCHYQRTTCRQIQESKASDGEFWRF